MVRDACTKRLDELEKAQPTIIFRAKDASGQDVSAVKVTVDGRPLADKLDGTALPVDPGDHVFTFTTADQPPVTKTFVIGSGEKERREPVIFGGAPASPTPAQPTAAVAPTPQPLRPRRHRVAAHRISAGPRARGRPWAGSSAAQESLASGSERYSAS